MPLMPEDDRDPGFDADEEVVWDADRDLDMWQDSDDDAIGGYAPCEC